MKDFDFKLFFDLHDKKLRYNIAANPEYCVLHLGQNDENIQDHKILKNSLEHLDIYARPKTVEDLYKALDINQGQFSNYMKIDDWENQIEQYDFVFNVEDSGKFLDQIKYFEAIDRIVKPGGHILNIVPYNSIFEKTYYSYNPAFFGYIAEHFDYVVESAYLGNLDATVTKSVDLDKHFRNDKYLKQYGINAFWLPTEGMRGPIFLGVAFKKKSRIDDTDSDTTDEVEVQS